jgi:hypothetical protein
MTPESATDFFGFGSIVSLIDGSFNIASPIRVSSARNQPPVPDRSAQKVNACAGEGRLVVI